MANRTINAQLKVHGLDELEDLLSRHHCSSRRALNIAWIAVAISLANFVLNYWGSLLAELIFMVGGAIGGAYWGSS